MNENLAVVNSEYTFITDDEAEGVITSLTDGKKVIEFINQKSSLLGFPKNKLILAGISAGAGIAIWNGLREDTNKNIIGMCMVVSRDKTVFIGDTNIIERPKPEELADIAEQMAFSVSQLGYKPRVAFASFANFGGTHRIAESFLRFWLDFEGPQGSRRGPREPQEGPK